MMIMLRLSTVWNKVGGRAVPAEGTRKKSLGDYLFNQIRGQVFLGVAASFVPIKAEGDPK
jgi:hypothetical protein